ncbi:motor, partial [Branchiostoma belcheri]
MAGSLLRADPDRYLFGDQKELSKLRSQAFDSKKNCWIPNDKDAFLATEIVQTKGDSLTVQTEDGKTFQVNKDDTQQMNPPKFEMTEDMANLTYLNEASVLYNLKQRYFHGLIYQVALLCWTRVGELELRPFSAGWKCYRIIGHPGNTWGVPPEQSHKTGVSASPVLPGYAGFPPPVIIVI